MQFQVPQFIEVEDKLVGPLTFKQFLYILGGGGACFLIWSLVSPISSLLAIILLTPFAALSLALSFYKINERPFSVILESGFKYFFKDRLYIWSKTPKNAPKEAAKKPEAAKPQITVPRLTESKLKDIAWSLDIQDTNKR